MSRLLKHGTKKKPKFKLQMESSELYQRRLEHSSGSNDSLQDALKFKEDSSESASLEADEYFARRPLPPIPSEDVGVELHIKERRDFLPPSDQGKIAFNIPYGATNLPVAQVPEIVTLKPSPEHFPGRPLPPIPVPVAEDRTEPIHQLNRNTQRNNTDSGKRTIAEIPFGTTNLPVDSTSVKEKDQNQADKNEYQYRSQNLDGSHTYVGDYDFTVHEPLFRTFSDDPGLRKKLNEESLSASYKSSLLARYDSSLPIPDFIPPPPPTRNRAALTSVEIDSCHHCNERFAPEEKMVTAQGRLWHTRCFVCVQCFRPFPNNLFYINDERRYCEHDYLTLFASTCKKCDTIINDRVIRTRSGTWHHHCFTCEECSKELADIQWRVIGNTVLCKSCYDKKNADNKGLIVCDQCYTVIDEKPLKFRGNQYHPWHFNCTNCGVQLTDTARALTINYTDDGKEILTQGDYVHDQRATLYCLKCHDRLGVPICGACRRPIEGRVIEALGKTWHVEHFVCARCERPFLGKRHYEMRGLPYCETHYHQQFGTLCFVCNSVITKESVSVMMKTWCVNHFSCFFCNRLLSAKSSLYEVDLRPSCKRCIKMLPKELRLRLKKYVDLATVK